MKSSAWKEDVGEDLHGERLAVPIETTPRELHHVPLAAVEPAGGQLVPARLPRTQLRERGRAVDRGLDVVRGRREARKGKTEAPRGVEGRRERDVRDRLRVGMRDGRQRGGHGGTGQEEHGGQCPEGMEHPLHARIIAHPTPRTVLTLRSVNPFNPWTGTRGRSGRVDKWASGRVCELE